MHVKENRNNFRIFFSNSDSSDSEEVIEKYLEKVRRKKAYEERKKAREKKKEAEMRDLYEQI